MGTILLVEDVPDLGTYEAAILEARGHRVLRCGGGRPGPWGPCPMLKTGSCTLADNADVIVLSASLQGPLRGRGYRGIHLLRAYRRRYGDTPMVVVAFGAPHDVEGRGPYSIVEKFSEPDATIAAIEDALAKGPARTKRATRSANGGRGKQLLPRVAQPPTW